MIWTDTGVGRAFAGERDVIVRPKEARTSYQPVLYAHGSEGGDGGSTQWMGIKTRWPVMQAVAERSLMVCADLGGNQTWGNDTAIARFSSARTYIRSIAGVKTGKVNILAQSMGATTALAWAAANPTLVGRIVLMIPVINLTDVRTNSALYRPSIDAAYGGTYTEAAHGATHNPLTMAQLGKLAGIPIQMWYGIGDSLCKPEFAVQFANAVSTCEPRPIQGGHAESTISGVNPGAVAAFLEIERP
jgi:hypothetical protein